jgi:DNA-binding response OmpR family regulator
MDQRSLVCVVDDDTGVRQTICMILETAGYVTSQARDGKEGLEAIARTRATIAVIDILMPNQEGLETIAQAKERFPGLKVLAITGGGQAGTLSYLTLASALGADAVLPKPFRSEELVNKVRQLG